MHSITIVLPDFDTEDTPAPIALTTEALTACANARVLALVLPAIRQFAARSVERLQWTVQEPEAREVLARRYGPPRPRATEAAVRAWMLAHAGTAMRNTVNAFTGPLTQLYWERSPLECLALAAALEARAMRLIERIESAGAPIDVRSREIIDDFIARNAQTGPTAAALLRRVARPGLIDRVRTAWMMRPINRRLKACFEAG